MSRVKLAIICLLIGAASTAGAQTVVYFNDANFQAAVREALDKPTGVILDSDMRSLTTLHADNRNIHNINGIQYATNLTTLSLTENQIEDLTRLSQLTQLVQLSLGYNRIRNLTPLQGLINIKRLGLYRNNIVNLQPISTLTNLESLHLLGNELSDLEPIAGLTNLQYLHLDENAISSLLPLASLTNMQYLYLGNNSISDLSPLAGLTKLRALLVSSNSISSLAPVAALTNLEELRAEDNQVRSIPPLADLTALRTLLLSYNAIEDIDGLSGLTHLTHLYLARNQISDIDALGSLGDLTHLYIIENQISDITSLGSLTTLTSLFLSLNQITDITGLESLSNLTTLYLGGNQISEITALGSLNNLTNLSIGGNQISDIGTLGSLTNLTSLSVSENQISDIDAIRSLTNLARLGLAGNQISDITALVDNPGLGSGDSLDLRNNPLSQRAICYHIPILLRRHFPSLSYDGTCSEPWTRIMWLSGNVDFGWVPVGQSAQRPVTVYNDGETDLIVDSITSPAPFTAIPQSFVVAAGASEEVTVTFTPEEMVPYLVILYFSSDMSSGTDTIAATGIGTGTPVVTNFAINGGQPVTESRLVSLDSSSAGYPSVYMASESPSFEGTSWRPYARWVEFELSPGSGVKTVYFKVRNVYSESLAVSATIEYRQPVVATPTISPEPATYFSAVEVSIACATEGAMIRYTIDGSEPDELSPVYVEPLVLTVPVTVKAAAWRDGMLPSATATAMYSLPDPVATPVITPGSGMYRSPLTVTMASATPEATIHFTLDGTEPSLASAVYTRPFALLLPARVKAKAWKDGMLPSPTAEADYQDGRAVELPVLTPTSGAYSLPLSVSITSATPDAILRYTLDGSSPDEQSPVYTLPIAVTLPKTIRARAWKEDMLPSGAAAATYRLATVAVPEIRPATNAYASPLTVTIDCVTPDVTIRYTDDGSTPDESSPVYSEPLRIELPRVIRAKAWKQGMAASGVATRNFTQAAVAMPEISPDSGHYSSPLNVIISCATPDATVRFTDTGDEPTEESPVYSAPLSVSLPATIKARAWKEGLAASDVVERVYAEISVAPPQVTPVSGRYAPPLSVTMTCATPGAIIRFTDDGTEPGQSSSVYSEAISIAPPKTIKAKAWLGSTASPRVTREYLLPELASPIRVDASDGVFADKVHVSWTTVTGATHYRVYRGTENDPLLAAPLGPWQMERSLDDFDAAAPTPVGDAPGCFVSPDGEFAYYPYVYWVKARNEASESPFNIPDAGYRGVAKNRVADAKIYESVMPAVSAGTSTFAIRILSEEEIDPDSVWAVAEGDDWTDQGGTWRSTEAGFNSDGWVVYAPDQPLAPQQHFRLTVGATTRSGVEVGPLSHEFFSAESPATVPVVTEVQVVSANLAPITAEPAVFRAGPAGVFDEPVAVRIPVPDGAAPEALVIWYYSESPEHEGWYREENVIGWMAPGSRQVVEEDGQLYLEITVNHSGIVQLVEESESGAGADVGLLLGVGIILLLINRGRWRRVNF